MKQILQNLGSGETLLAEVPAPLARAGHLLIRTDASLVSLGTEKMLVSFGQTNLLEKARQQPERVKQVLQKIRTDGLFAAISAVRAKLLRQTVSSRTFDATFPTCCRAHVRGSAGNDARVYNAGRRGVKYMDSVLISS